VGGSWTGGGKQKMLLYGKRLEDGLEDNRLVKVVVQKLKDAERVG